MKHPPRLHLAQAPTPVVPLARVSARTGKDIWVMRDDLTGFALSGNKVRKLEYLLADALAHGATHIVTCGGPQSNHARATAFAARQLGLAVTIVVREQPEGPQSGVATGNALLDRMLGARIVSVSYDEFSAAGDYAPFLDSAVARLAESGETPYVVDEGGSSPLGCFGYLNAALELQRTWQDEALPGRFPDNVFLAVGSGGTHAGLRLGTDHLGVDPAAVCGVPVTRDSTFFGPVITDLMRRSAAQYDLRTTDSGPRLIDGHVGEGYAVATDEELRHYAAVAEEEGLLLDPVYTGKAFRGMLTELTTRPDDYGQTILFLHTGGGFATFAFAEQYERALHVPAS